ncbi:molybdopterin molybdenumtransferase MoeA [Arsenicitalea aurantiaca]|uniref:Molybdopterin molybdenumtransferase n=1 Tax=Arsenicitalea aurantiaca TaxID=1783274 RepID=A0A433XF51_9HYPH|nr:gephyrin-like molybdotransferase Glp [Arsenicitalea aurantiaca]RUT32747.1 molybdopterin molybdenumtransferase MoeA [Arsenicitalea aurantiaca]
MTLLPVDEALSRILARVPAPVRETVALEDAAGRILAEPLLARHNQPPFDASAMDGYAVRASDVVPGRALKLVGTAQAGQRFVGLMGPGQCVRVFTGAPLPIGADAVIMQEEADANGNAIAFAETPSEGLNIRPAGNDFHRGQALLAPGTRLTPFGLAMAAAANQPRVTVTRGPRIAMLATGDELVAPGTSLGPDQIVASNSFGLGAMFAPYASRVTDLGIAPDKPQEIEARLLKAFDAGVDVVVTTGGASVGERDFMREVLIDLGVSLDFWRIAMRPGKPLMFGTRGKTLVFGLPGNPVSSMVTATVLLKPALRQLLGASDVLGPRLHLPLASDLAANSARRHFMRGTLVSTPTGSAVEPIAQTDSAHTSSLAKADLLIVQPENDPGRSAGSLIEVIPLDAW